MIYDKKTGVKKRKKMDSDVNALIKYFILKKCYDKKKQIFIKIRI